MSDPSASSASNASGSAPEPDVFQTLEGKAAQLRATAASLFAPPHSGGCTEGPPWSWPKVPPSAAVGTAPGPSLGPAPGPSPDSERNAEALLSQWAPLYAPAAAAPTAPQPQPPQLPALQRTVQRLDSLRRQAPLARLALPAEPSPVASVGPEPVLRGAVALICASVGYEGLSALALQQLHDVAGAYIRRVLRLTRQMFEAGASGTGIPPPQKLPRY